MRKSKSRSVALCTRLRALPALVRDIQDRVKRETAPHEYARGVVFVRDLPNTLSGKIRRVELRKLEEARRAKAAA